MGKIVKAVSSASGTALTKRYGCESVNSRKWAASGLEQSVAALPVLWKGSSVCRARRFTMPAISDIFIRFSASHEICITREH